MFNEHMRASVVHMRNEKDNSRGLHVGSTLFFIFHFLPCVDKQDMNDDGKNWLTSMPCRPITISIHKRDLDLECTGGA